MIQLRSLALLLSLALFAACNADKTNSSKLHSDAAASQFVEPNTLYAQTKPDDITASRRNAITQAVSVASPAVVGINVTEVREYQYVDPFNDPFFDQFFGRRRKTPTYKQEVKSLGSGFFISQDGYIITNSHVVSNGNATKIVVTMTNGKRYDAKLIGTDALMDVAVLKIDGSNFPYLKLGDSDEVIVGEWAIALGNPFGLFEINDKPSVTVGVVSSVGLNFPDVEGKSYKGMIQTDAAINSGNSGGPLLNSNAEVIGVNTFIYTGGGQGSIGIGFSIPMNRARKLADELKQNGKIDRSFSTGISVQNLDGLTARALNLPRDLSGVVVVEVDPRSAGGRAGVQSGDVIVEANGIAIKTEQALLTAIRELRAGDTLKLKVYRERRYVELIVKLEKAS